MFYESELRSVYSANLHSQMQNQVITVSLEFHRGALWVALVRPFRLYLRTDNLFCFPFLVVNEHERRVSKIY